MPRQGEYLFKRAGSNNWWLRFQYPKARHPDPRKVELSLGTPDRTEAELKALPYIHAHRAKVLVRRALVEGRLKEGKEIIREFEPGREHHTSSGERLLATDTQLFFLDETGRIIRTRSNGSHTPFTGFTPQEERELLTIRKRWRPERRDADEAILNTWIKQRAITGYEETKARSIFKTFKEAVNGKALASCTRDDGRKLTSKLQSRGIKAATVQKHVGYLCAAVNLAIDEGKLRFNPFSKIVPKADDALQRLPLDDDDMALVRSHLGELALEERLLWIWLANTGMRLSEPSQVHEEFVEKGIRFVRVGTKTEQSDRYVPIPDALLPFIPEKISSPVFSRDPKHLGRRLMRFMRRIGIVDERKVLHSLRHRAKDRLRAEGCPQDIQYALLGHEKKTVAAGYGQGFPLTVLKPWVEKIGW